MLFVMINWFVILQQPREWW